MRITKQSSGAHGEQGRGEYELCDYAPNNGLGPSDLLNRNIRLRIGSLEFDTGVRVTKDQGKYRLRLNEHGRYRQVPNQIASILLMPPPARSEASMAGGEIVLLNDSYVMKNIVFSSAEKVGNDSFTAEVDSVECDNRTMQGERILVADRMAQIERVWAERDSLPSSIRDLLAKHEGIVRSGTIPPEARALVERLQQDVANSSAELDVPYAPKSDVLPALLDALFDTNLPLQALTSLDQVEPEASELRRRLIQAWSKQASRGSAGRQFRKAVREAYRMQCVICGKRFPKTPYTDNPGIDAAHILPWSEYDLDQIYNGLALCKLHHWAFDEHLLVIRYKNEGYVTEFDLDLENKLTWYGFSVEALKECAGPIPLDRLPPDRHDWPRPDLLDRLNSDSAFKRP